ncbi:unnamed protein product [marine sediment metagenome]|uniref:Uncharacterized protein n=1 Tax=marine sediment metagenome TaxID=412755 RepID=X1BAH6_9ZZZZ
MRECPFIDEREEELNDGDLMAFCQSESQISYTHCPIYKRLMKAKQGKPHLQKPGERKKEKGLKLEMFVRKEGGSP